MSKRTYEQSLTFFKHKTHTRGQGRELYSTPRKLIQVIVTNLLCLYPFLEEYIWVDPCASDGRWEQEIRTINPKIKCISFDIKPLNDSVIEYDFFKLNKQKIQEICCTDKIFFIGNPPFSKVEKFIKHSLLIGAEYSFFLGGSAILTGKLSQYVKTLFRFSGAEGKQKDLRSKVIFIDTNEKLVPIWCCGAFCNENFYEKFDRIKEQKDGYFSVSPKLWCEDNKNRIKEICL